MENSLGQAAALALLLGHRLAVPLEYLLGGTPVVGVLRLTVRPSHCVPQLLDAIEAFLELRILWFPHVSTTTERPEIFSEKTS